MSLALDSLPGIVVMSDPQGRILHANDAWFNLCGHDRDHCDWQDIIHPDDLAGFGSTWIASIETFASFEIRQRLRSADQEYRWVLHKGKPTVEGKTLKGFVSTCTEIHEAVTADYEHGQFFDIASDILLTNTTSGHIGKINGAVERILGWTIEEILAIPLRDLLHPDDMAATYALRSRLFAGEEIVDFENRYRCKDGSYRWLSWRTRYDPVSDQIFGCAVDIHQRKTYEQDLEKTVQRLDLAMAASSEAVWDFDIETKALFVSKRYLQVLGLSDETAPTTSDGWMELCHPDDRPKVTAALADYLEGRADEYRFMGRMRHRDGTWRWLLSRAVALRDVDGRPLRLVGVHSDISQQQENEENLRHLKERAEAASRAKTDFLANMSHEIRTPMNAVVGAAHILSLGSLTEEKRKKVIDVLMQGANSMMSVINDLLDISRIESQSLQLDQVEFDARDLVADVVKVLDLQAVAKGLAIQVQNTCACVTERLFIGDRDRIRQILLNLCGNAVKFTDRGVITIAISCEHTASAGIEELIFSISDTGIGIESEKLELIFGKFEQADTSITRRFGGSGLGLTIARAVSEAMGGKIEAHSELGVGSTFTVTLPLRRGTATDDAAAPASEPVTPRRSAVLLVEDNPGNVMVASHFLEDFGYQYDVATSGAEALARLKNGARYDLILMDIQLPGMDGRETTRRLRTFESESGQSACPVVAMTAHAMLADREACLAAGMNDYISKPFDPENLRAILRVWIAPMVEAAPAG